MPALRLVCDDQSSKDYEWSIKMHDMLVLMPSFHYIPSIHVVHIVRSLQEPEPL